MGYQSLLNFKNALDNNKVNFNYHKEKIITDLIWNQIIFSKYSNKIVINEKKLEEKIKNQKNTSKLYNLDEIVFQVDDINDIQKKFDLIQNDINNLGFENAVLKYSVSDSMANKGKLGWVDQKSINSIILNELDLIPIGSTTKPIRIASGFLILKKNEIKVIDKKINIDEELKKLIEFEKNQQLRNYSNLYFNKVKKNSIINEP
jgi:peptidyl-prolyl cis-trans isomerase SurA